ncbi:MAG: hypothetical protein PHY80_02800 [Rickettsiales bacterium]|nr:hypothetical protein [Rickettsiales bacterium]
MLEFKKQEIPLFGDVKIQGDKDISCLSLILSSLANGKSKIYNLSESEDIINLINILHQFGIEIKKDIKDNCWTVDGKGLHSLKEPDNIVDVKNSQEILYLLIGLLSSYDFKVFFKGTNELSNISIEDIISIFKKINVKFDAKQEKKLPFLMIGNGSKNQIIHEIYEYNSMLKNSLLFASLIKSKTNTIKEKEKSKDHLEILMKYFGINFEEHELGNKGNLSTKIGKEIILIGDQEFSGKEINIAGDTTISAFIASLAILIPDSDITLKNILMNQYRDSFYRTLIDMGANINFVNKRISCGEKVLDINIKYSELKDTVIPANRIYKMLNEYPFLILLASLTQSKITIQGTDIIKEKDLENYNYILSVIKSLGVDFIDFKNNLIIEGKVKNFDEKIILDKSKINFETGLALLSFGCFTKNGISIDENFIESNFSTIKEVLQKLKVHVTFGDYLI